MIYVLYNPLAGNGQCEAKAKTLTERYPDSEVSFHDATAIEDLNAFLSTLGAEDRLILAGGDGTIHHFVNHAEDRDYPFPICCYPIGSGNDFIRDVLGEVREEVVEISPYLRHLPTVTVNGEERKFLNGIGFGIDGYCCEVGDRQRAKSDKPVNYAAIAIKGMLFHFHQAKATITVDGAEEKFTRVWLAPTMNGRYYGGGMMVAPEQARLNEKKELTVVVMHAWSKLKTLIVFPTLFKGTHVKHTEMVRVRKGKEITVTFDRPTALQIDGETISGVTSYTARAAALVTA